MSFSFGFAFIAVVFVLAGFVKGVIGLGLPTVSVGLLGVVMSPMAAASLLVIPNLVTNVWQLAAGPSFSALLRRLWPMMLGIALGTFAGMPLISAKTSPAATAALGLALVAYAAIGLAGAKLPTPRGAEPLISGLVGAVTGVITAITGVFVVPAVPYLQALGLDKDDLVQALGLSFLVSTVALAVALVVLGIFQSAVAGGSLLALAPALLGMALGTRVRAMVSPTTFKRCFFAGLLALGGYLAARGVGAA
jgi:uncharacterized membrane protein YfcA